MASNQRNNVARAKEFDLIFSFLGSPSVLHEYITLNQQGGICRSDGLDIEFGKVSQYFVHLNKSTIENPFDFIPTYCCHLDRILSKRKRLIEKKYNLTPGCISGRETKADLFFVAEDNTPYFVSVKDIGTHSKLGQVSAETSYGSARLKGGLGDLVLPRHKIPKTIDFRDTALTEDQFKKITQRGREYAFFKKNFNSEWLQLVEPIEETAQRQLMKFANIINEDQFSLIEFIGKILAGNLRKSSDFYILLGEEKVQITKFLSTLKSLNVEVEIEPYTPLKSEKTSLIIWLIIKNTKYCLTKIEISFDGKKLFSTKNKSISQVKGIIYYFQQHLTSGNHYKKLLLDIGQ